MWWNDIKELRILYQKIHANVLSVEAKVDDLMGNDGDEGCVLGDVTTRIEDVEHKLEAIKEILDDNFHSEYDHSPFDRIVNRLDALLADKERIQQVELATKTLDKFEDYMKNVDKLNSMINEFKGCVSIARAAIAERKDLGDDFETNKIILKNMIQTFQKYYDQQASLGDLRVKLDEIYKSVSKKKIATRKKKASPSPQSE